MLEYQTYVILKIEKKNCITSITNIFNASNKKSIL
jgi:hypothetical protein